MNELVYHLDGKVAVVTAASHGIGKDLALALADAGATVAVTDRDTNAVAVQAVCDEITGAGGTAHGYELDMRKTESISTTIDRVVAELGHLDIMVNYAWGAALTPSLEVTEEDWDKLVDVNLKGLFFCAQAAARHMVAQGSGRIINICSERAISARPGAAPYCASMAGIAGLTRSLALEWIKDGVTVNTVGIAPTISPGERTMSPEAEAEYVGRSPLDRRLEPHEFTGATVFLSTDAASAVNGHLLMVDGGWTVG